jgi:hypothetical protein
MPAGVVWRAGRGAAGRPRGGPESLAAWACVRVRVRGVCRRPTAGAAAAEAGHQRPAAASGGPATPRRALLLL